MIYVVGIRLYMYLHHEQNISLSGTVMTTLIMCVALVVAAAEAFYWLVERPSKLLTHSSYKWITK